MANDDHVSTFPPFSSPSTPSRSLPLHLSGFLSGDTVQVQGDTANLQFSVKFNVCRKEQNFQEPLNFPDVNIPDDETFPSSIQSPPPSPCRTPTSTLENQDETANAMSEISWSRDEIVTRLRSGVLFPVNYSPPRSCGVLIGNLNSGKKKRIVKNKGKADNVFEKMLKRRSLPLRPCSSYAFFVMANWSVVKSPSFEETSKRLSKRWQKLNEEMKKEYVEMAIKDSRRYKKQYTLLMNHTEELLTDADSE